MYHIHAPLLNQKGRTCFLYNRYIARSPSLGEYILSHILLYIQLLTSPNAALVEISSKYSIILLQNYNLHEILFFYQISIFFEKATANL